MKRDKTLDLTMFNFTRLGIKIRERHLADYAYDMWKKGNRLAKIRLLRDQYQSLKRDLIKNNSFVGLDNHNLETIDLGFGQVKLEVEN